MNLKELLLPILRQGTATTMVQRLKKFQTPSRRARALDLIRETMRDGISTEIFHQADKTSAGSSWAFDHAPFAKKRLLAKNSIAWTHPPKRTKSTTNRYYSDEQEANKRGARDDRENADASTERAHASYYRAIESTCPIYSMKPDKFDEGYECDKMDACKRPSSPNVKNRTLCELKRRDKRSEQCQDNQDIDVDASKRDSSSTVKNWALYEFKFRDKRSEKHKDNRNIDVDASKRDSSPNVKKQALCEFKRRDKRSAVSEQCQDKQNIDVDAFKRALSPNVKNRAPCELKSRDNKRTEQCQDKQNIDIDASKRESSSNVNNRALCEFEFRDKRSEKHKDNRNIDVDACKRDSSPNVKKQALCEFKRRDKRSAVSEQCQDKQSIDDDASKRALSPNVKNRAPCELKSRDNKRTEQCQDNQNIDVDASKRDSSSNVKNRAPCELKSRDNKRTEQCQDNQNIDVDASKRDSSSNVKNRAPCELKSRDNKRTEQCQDKQNIDIDASKRESSSNVNNRALCEFQLRDKRSVQCENKQNIDAEASKHESSPKVKNLSLCESKDRDKRSEKLKSKENIKVDASKRESRAKVKNRTLSELDSRDKPSEEDRDDEDTDVDASKPESTSTPNIDVDDEHRHRHRHWQRYLSNRSSRKPAGEEDSRPRSRETLSTTFRSRYDVNTPCPKPRNEARAGGAGREGEETSRRYYWQDQSCPDSPPPRYPHWTHQSTIQPASSMYFAPSPRISFFSSFVKKGKGEDKEEKNGGTGGAGSKSDADWKNQTYEVRLKIYKTKIVDDWYHMEHQSIVKRSLEPHTEVHARLTKDARVHRAEQQRAKSRSKRDLIIERGPSNLQAILNDERWPQMWYLNRGDGLDMNVQSVWAEGITGSGVVVTILDDGLEKDHPDLYKNYDPQASYDVNSHDEDPMPRYDLVDSNRHGTRCAGEVAATANNTVCAVGVAFGAGVGGVRMLDGDVTDAVEARSLSLNPQHIDIYSASWGPDDDGKTVDGPGELATRAFIEGITKGRNGRGSIFVWASGNGGRDHDNCNCDGYTNSIWTLSISSATENGLVPWYSEACSSTLATTYSSGSNDEKQVVTTDLHRHCTSSHTGTSASAPLAAGICALALEANKDLTWRDMQHIVVRTAKPANLKAIDWVINGVGRNVSHSFGYGLMDATAMVRLARKWRTVPEQHKCEVSAPHTGRSIPAKSQLILDLHVKECTGVNFLEHVQAKVSLMATRRGDLQIHLTSPQGTKSTLLAKRPHDVSKAGFNQWPFMSVHTWGERPHGTWKLEIHNEGRYLDTLEEWKLVFYGTETSLELDEDELDKDKPSPVNIQQQELRNNVGTDSRHNIVDTEGDPWTGSQQVERVSHPEVQRPTTENKTSGCRSYASKGSGRCLECKEEWHFYRDTCYKVCPIGTYAVANDDGTRKICSVCHYTCLTCSGPSDAECLTCHQDSILWPNVGESRCVSNELSLRLESTNWFYGTTIFLAINLAIAVAAISYMVITWYVKKRKTTNCNYIKIPYTKNGNVCQETQHLRTNDCVSDSE